MHCPRLPLCVALLLALAAGPAFAAQGEVVTADGSRYLARLSQIGPDWRLKFRNAQGDKTLAGADLVSWGTIKESGGGAIALLPNGGQLWCQLRFSDRERVKLDSPVFGQLDLPLAQVTGIVLVTPANTAARDKLVARVRGAAGEQDRLLLENGDELGGTIASINHEAVELEAQAGTARIELAKIVAIVFNPALAARNEAAGLRMIVGFAEGSRIVADAAEMPTSGTIKLTAAGGWNAETVTEEVTFLQTLGGRARYLSDLGAAGYRHIPFLSLTWPFERDRSVTGGLLRSGDRVYPKGLGMHSTSRVSYAIESGDERFEAEVAIDASSGGRGSVAFRVYVDNEQRYASEVIRGRDEPKLVKVDVKGGKRLSLIVDFAERGDELDHANWLNARFVR